MGYTSQDETIYARADALGISHDAIYDYFDKMANEVNEKYPGKSPDWRIEKAEQSVWSMFCTYSIPQTRPMIYLLTY